MATIIMGSYMVRYPFGGNLSWALQYLVGFKKLGHDIYFVEKYVHPDSCYDPVKRDLSDDCSYGVKVVANLLARYGLENKWCFVERGEKYHGMSKNKISEIFKRADLYIENGAHGAWEEESSSTTRIFIDVDPTLTQIKFFNDTQKGIPIKNFQRYFTNGLNVGIPGNVIPTNGINWKSFFNPVNTHLFQRVKPSPRASYSTIMNWKSYDDPVQYNSIDYGHKNLEFEKFKILPSLVNVPMEMAVSGIKEPDATLVKQNGWDLKEAQEITFSVNSFQNYLYQSKGEFSVCKHMYVATNSGWFSDKSAAYMASARPVVLQETGFSQHLPTGEGLFAVKDAGEAKDAIERIEKDYDFHSKRAYEIACEYLEAKKVLEKILSEIGI